MTGSRLPDQRALIEQVADLVPVARDAGAPEAAAYLAAVAALANPAQPTDPDVLTQLAALRSPAVRMGLYDADDFLRAVTNR